MHWVGFANLIPKSLGTLVTKHCNGGGLQRLKVVLSDRQRKNEVRRVFLMRFNLRFVNF